MIMVMHSLAAANRSTDYTVRNEAEAVVLETSCYAFGGRIRLIAKVNVNKDNMFYCIIIHNLLIIVASCYFRCILSID